MDSKEISVQLQNARTQIDRMFKEIQALQSRMEYLAYLLENDPDSALGAEIEEIIERNSNVV